MPWGEGSPRTTTPAASQNVVMLLKLDSLALDPDQRNQVDEFIVTNRKPQAFKAMRDASGCSLTDAIEILGTRHQELRENRPDDFTVRAEPYWDGFYS